MPRPEPSPSALHVARRRAAHQAFDEPRVLDDPFALRVFGLSENSSRDQIHAAGVRAPARASSRALRAFQVARARFAEDVVRSAYASGVRQYVVLAAGLDTFALRNPYADLRTVEVDLPATQAWKRGLLARNGLAEPATLALVAADLQDAGLPDALSSAGLNVGEPTVVSAMGVVPYLRETALRATLAWVGALPAGSSLVMDYRLPRTALPPHEQRELDSLAARVAAAGESFHLLLTPDAIRHLLAEFHLQVEMDVGAEELNQRYFAQNGSVGALTVTAEATRVVHACR